MALGVYPCSRATARTDARVLVEMRLCPFRARDTVDVETPTRSEMVRIVERRPELWLAPDVVS
jgi:hypothetical protein